MKEIKHPKYSRILLKLSGEPVGGQGVRSIDAKAVNSMAEQIREVRDLGVQVVIVLGGGNIFRGLAGSEKGIERGHGGLHGYAGHRHQPIGERDPGEVTSFWAQQVAPEGVKPLNLAFDVTPAAYISAVITERGAFRPRDLKRLAHEHIDLGSLRITA